MEYIKFSKKFKKIPSGLGVESIEDFDIRDCNKKTSKYLLELVKFNHFVILRNDTIYTPSDQERFAKTLGKLDTPLTFRYRRV